MSTKKRITKKQLEKYFEELVQYRDEEIQPFIDKVDDQLNAATFSTTPPGPQPKNPPGIPGK